MEKGAAVAASLFGTDGVRGVANADLSCELAFALGRGAVAVLGPRIVVGRDTRRSGTMLESALVAGIMSAGGTALCCGVIPTPAVALLTRSEKADAGAVISASHNPPEYNGIKFFNAAGYKAGDTQEEAISSYVQAYLAGRRPGDAAGSAGGCAGSEDSASGVPAEDPHPTHGKLGTLIKLKHAREHYIRHAVDSLDASEADLSGLVIALDCAHGASCQTTPEALRRLGATVHCINTDFSGMDINVDCGSTHLDPVRSLLRATGADLGIAHDGDADRVLFIDAAGNDVDGDFVLAICARDLKERGQLPHNRVVSTVMCNLGFVRAMQGLGISVDQTPVGDRFVLQQMLDSGAVLGGEQSGHIIFTQHNSTGDGLMTAVQLLGVMKRTGKSLAELACVMQRYPQTLVNVRSARCKEWQDNPAIRQAIAQAASELGDQGRILVRASGTEPLVRVMVEAATKQDSLDCAQRVAQVVCSELDGE